MPIERLAPELDRLISVDQEIEVLGSGYGTAWGCLGVRTPARAGLCALPLRSRKRKKFLSVDIARASELCAIPSHARRARKLRKSATESVARSSWDGG